MSEDNAEPKQKRKASGDNVTTLRTENMTSGEILRAAREKRKLSLEDVSAAIHVRTAQLRAIEEGNIDALPGMTYAVGFVKSYASYLKLNPIDLGNKFKTEHGALKPLMPDLPEIKPVVESRMPDPRIVGVGAFFAVVLLLGWTLFGGDETSEGLDIAPVAGVEGEAPQVGVEIAAENVTEEIAGDETPVETSGSPEEAAPAKVADEKPAKDVKEDAKAKEEDKKEQAAEKAEDKKEAEVAAQAPATSEDEQQASEAVAALDAEAAKKKAAAEAVANVAAAQTQAEQPAMAAEEPITIRKAGRVVFKAKQTSWVQISDAEERVVFKKLLRAGEQYTVPEGKGYTLITTNAGGLDVIVDGKQAPALGKSGEILRGLPLEPSELTRVKRVRSRINN